MKRKWLKKLRKESGCSQLEIAKALGVVPSYISMIEGGERQKKMSLELAQKISEIFDVPLEIIFAYEKREE